MSNKHIVKNLIYRGSDRIQLEPVFWSSDDVPEYLKDEYWNLLQILPNSEDFKLIECLLGSPFIQVFTGSMPIRWIMVHQYNTATMVYNITEDITIMGSNIQRPGSMPTREHLSEINQHLPYVVREFINKLVDDI